MKRLLMITLLATVPAGAAAQQTSLKPVPLPIIDVDKYCAYVAQPGAGVNLCIEQEQQDYDELKLLWNKMTPQDQAESAKISEYDHMLTVVTQVIQAEQAQQQLTPQPPAHFQP